MSNEDKNVSKSSYEDFAKGGRFNPFLVLGIINANSATPYVRIAITEPEFGIMDVPIHILYQLTMLSEGNSSYAIACPVRRLNYFTVEKGWSMPNALYILRAKNGSFYTTDIRGNRVVWNYAELKYFVHSHKDYRFLNIIPKEKLLYDNLGSFNASDCLEWSSKDFLVLGNSNYCIVTDKYARVIQTYLGAATLRCKMSRIDCEIRFGDFVGGYTFTLKDCKPSDMLTIPPQVNYIDRMSFAYACPAHVFCDNPYLMLIADIFSGRVLETVFLSSVIWADPACMNSALIRKLFLRPANMNFEELSWWSATIRDLHIEYASEYSSLCTSKDIRNTFVLHKVISEDGILAISDFPNLDVSMSDYYATVNPYPAYIPGGIKGLSKPPVKKSLLKCQGFIHDVNEVLRPDELYRNTTFTSKFPRIAP